MTSENFDRKDKVTYWNNDWYFDTFEVASARQDGSGFTASKQHYDGPVRNRRADGIFRTQHTNWYTSPDEMFVLKQVQPNGA